MATTRKNALTGFRIAETTINKLRFIAHQDIATLNDTGATAIEDYISRWEKKNGAITDEQIEKIIKKTKPRGKQSDK